MNMRGLFWNAFFLLFFVVLVLLGYGWLMAAGRLGNWISLGDFLLIALAVFRLVRLFSYDLITKFIRDWFDGAPRDTFSGTISSLLHCPWCTGLWFSAFVVFFYFATPLAWPLILILALASIASMFQIIANLIGWSAEAKKRMVLGNPAGDSGSTCG